jgi:hypothetical protein
MSASDEHSPPVGSGEAPPVGSVHLAWRALTASLTGALLAIGLAAVWASVLVIPQGASNAQILSRFPYAQAQAIRSLGLHDVATSWPSLGIMLLLLIHGVGLILSSRERRSAGFEVGDSAWSAQATTSISRPLPELLEELESGAHGSFYGDPQGLRLWRGFWREGLALVVLGLLVSLASIPVDRLVGLDARVTLAAAPGETVSTPVATRIRDFGGWVDGETPVGLSCHRPDPADALRRRSCVLQTDEGAVSLTLRAGATTTHGAITLRPEREVPRRQSQRTALLLEHPGEGPRVLRGVPGRTYELADGSRLTAFEGPDGPLVIAREKEGAPALLLGAGGTGHRAPAGRSISGVPAWSVEVAVQIDPGRPLRLAGGALLIIGLLLMVLVPHVEIHLRAAEEGVVATARSHNRAGLPAAVCAALGPRGGSP